MDNKQLIKVFIGSAKDYIKQKTESTTNSLHRYLQILSATSDLTVFEPGSCEAAEFYVTLYEVMGCLDAHSEMLWCAISILQDAARNPNARNSLIHTYKFVPILSRLLSAPLIPEKRFRVLHLLQELTYGVQISWQEGHLPFLISTLITYICGDDSELTSVALGVLVNLCYKNLPAVYTLMRCVDTKNFLRTILKLQRDKVDTRVQVCKLMMILDHLSKDIPDAEILTFVMVTFTMLGKAFDCGNVCLMRHIVDFFKDIKDNAHARNVLASYPTYVKDTQTLVDTLSVKTSSKDLQCTNLLIEFIHLLLSLKVTNLEVLYPQIVVCGLTWIDEETTSAQALDLIYIVLVQCRSADSQTETYKDVIARVDEKLQILIGMLEKGIQINTGKNDNKTYTALLRLFQEMVSSSSLHVKIGKLISKNVFEMIFQPLLASEPGLNDNLFHQSRTVLYVQAMCLLSELMIKNSEWMILYSELLQQKKVLMVLAVALYSSDNPVKQQVLFLTGTSGFPRESLTLLSQCMSELNQLVVLAPAATNLPLSLPATHNIPEHDAVPLFTLAQQGAIDSFISKMEELFSKNQVQDITTSAVIELYQYKVSSMHYTERAMQTNLETSTLHVTHLTHRLAQMTAEMARLHQLLYANSQTIEGNKLEVLALKEQLQTAEHTAKSLHNKAAQLNQDMNSKTRIISEQKNEIEKLTNTIREKNKICEESEEIVNTLKENLSKSEKSIEALINDKTELSKTCTKLQEKLEVKERVIIEKNIEIENRVTTNQTLEREIANQRALIKGLERTISDKDSELSEQQKQLQELIRMREIIYEISAGKKKEK